MAACMTLYSDLLLRIIFLDFFFFTKRKNPYFGKNGGELRDFIGNIPDLRNKWIDRGEMPLSIFLYLWYNKSEKQKMLIGQRKKAE